jgi:hypothetical protein
MLKSTIKNLNLGFVIGDEVTVDNEQIYGNYTQFVKLHIKYAPRFQYQTWELDESAKRLKVIGVHRHVKGKTAKYYDNNKYVVVVADARKRIYLVGESGVKKVID